MFKALGIKFTKRLDEISDINYQDKIKEMKVLLTHWSKRNLTPIGRITVIKSLALSKINHLILSLPNPSQKIITEIHNMFYDFLWQKGQDRIKRALIIQSYENGGLRMVDVKQFIVALKATWIRRIIVSNKKYKAILLTNVPYIADTLIFGKEYTKRKTRHIKNLFWKDVLVSYCLLFEALKPKSWSEILKMPLWFNHNLKVGGTSVYYPAWHDKGILYLNDLVDENGKFLNYTQCVDLYRVTTNFLQYQGIINSINNYILNCNINPQQCKEHIPLRPLHLEYLLKDKKGCRSIYDIIIKNDKIKPSSVNKWQNYLDLNLELSWKFFFYLPPFKVTNDTTLRWFQYRINNRILGTNSFLHKIRISNSDRCSFCNIEAETIEHLFCDCEHTRNFWTDLITLIQEKCDNVDIGFSRTDILFGNSTFKALSNIILLEAKRYIYSSKMRKNVPSIEGFIIILKNIYKVGRYTASKSQTLQAFEQKWAVYKGLIADASPDREIPTTCTYI